MELSISPTGGSRTGPGERGQQVVDIMDSDISSNKGSPPREAPTDYGTHSSCIYETFQPMEPIEIANKMQSNQNVNKSFSDSSQIEPLVHQFYGMSIDVADNGKASTGDRSAYQPICGSTTSQTQTEALASSSSVQSSYQQLDKYLEIIKKYRLRRNRQAVKDVWRRQMNRVRRLKEGVYLLQMQKKSFREAVYLRKDIADKQK